MSIVHSRRRRAWQRLVAWTATGLIIPLICMRVTGDESWAFRMLLAFSTLCCFNGIWLTVDPGQDAEPGSPPAADVSVVLIVLSFVVGVFGIFFALFLPIKAGSGDAGAFCGISIVLLACVYVAGFCEHLCGRYTFRPRFITGLCVIQLMLLAGSAESPRINDGALGACILTLAAASLAPVRTRHRS